MGLPGYDAGSAAPSLPLASDLIADLVTKVTAAVFKQIQPFADLVPTAGTDLRAAIPHRGTSESVANQFRPL